MSPAAIAYRGRFAPSPTGPLHAGSLVAALASWLDARAHGGVWLVRIEDLDPPRESPGAAEEILQTLADFGLESDEPVVRQSRRSALYRAALERLRAAGLVYACRCSRSEVTAAAREQGLPAGVYPGTCRELGLADGPGRALRVRVPKEPVSFMDRAFGRYTQNLEPDVGDFVLRRADGYWSYQLAVVVDDAAQRITDIVRGADLLDNTPRQIALQRMLGLTQPRYLHVPVVLAPDGQKLSKQTGATALDRGDPVSELQRAAAFLGMPPAAARSCDQLLQAAVRWWRDLHVRPPTIGPEERR
jgi:glutamyl-Q tRNA(Asp) synthetase